MWFVVAGTGAVDVAEAFTVVPAGGVVDSRAKGAAEATEGGTDVELAAGGGGRSGTTDPLVRSATLVSISAAAAVVAYVSSDALVS